MSRTPMRSIVLATRNPGKLREIRQALAGLPVEVVSLETFGDLPHPPEDGLTFAENARAKALAYARATGCWCLADDSGLCVDALGGDPGVRSARYADAAHLPLASQADIDAANNAKLLAELARRGVAEADRTARFVCCLALSDGRDILLETRGAIEGRILHQPRGDNGFGYDPVFSIDPLRCTAAELSTEQKNLISHRGQAVRELACQLGRLLAARG
jgi:XTP/dITP diphosphohydrolase